MAATTSPEFEQTKEKLIQLLTQEYGKNKLELSKMMAVFYILGQAKSQGEMIAMAKIFLQDFPILGEFLSQEKAMTHTKMEGEIQAIIQKMVKDDPIKAAQIAQKAMEQNVTLETLKDLFPEISKYEN
ncbi:MAG: hypothetical protein AAB551_02675 [Patescibacteria group bacterium]